MNKDQTSAYACAQASEDLLCRMLDGERSCGCGFGSSEVTDHCSGGRHTWGLEDYPLAMVYAPLQTFCKTYELDEALEAGTMFSELDLPFHGARVGKGGKC